MNSELKPGMVQQGTVWPPAPTTPSLEPAASLPDNSQRAILRILNRGIFLFVAGCLVLVALPSFGIPFSRWAWGGFFLFAACFNLRAGQLAAQAHQPIIVIQSVLMIVMSMLFAIGPFLLIAH